MAVWDEVRFAFDPELSAALDLSATAVQRSERPETQAIEEKYTCDSSGSVEVTISNKTAEYFKAYRLGRWSAQSPPVTPGRKKKAKTEGR